jgi:hypothetical protein
MHFCEGGSPHKLRGNCRLIPSGRSDRTPRTLEQFRRSLSAAARIGPARTGRPRRPRRLPARARKARRLPELPSFPSTTCCGGHATPSPVKPYMPEGRPSRSPPNACTALSLSNNRRRGFALADVLCRGRDAEVCSPLSYCEGLSRQLRLINRLCVALNFSQGQV